MNKNSKQLKIYITVILLLTVAATTLRTAACLVDLDFIYGYFESKTLINTATALIVSAVVVAFSFLFASKKVMLHPSFSSPSTYVPTGIVGAALMFFSARIFADAKNASELGAKPIVIITSAICGVCALLSIVHFFLNAFLTEARTELRAYFATATVMALSTYTALIFFREDGMALNSPNKLVSQMAFLLAALFFLYEARISLGREKWRGYCIFGLAAMALNAYSAFPALILYFTKGQAICASLEEMLLSVALFIFVAARMVLTVSLPMADKNEKIALLENAAEERASIAADTELRYDEAYAEQLTIDNIIPDEEFPTATEDASEEEFVFPSAEEFSTVFDEPEYDDDDGQIEIAPDLFGTPATPTEDDTDETEE
ncbi:MAG: hypothetical protein IKV43_00720 [Clostridia bacterium]|nr:hypothetical protein [Clostridia bacterium]